MRKTLTKGVYIKVNNPEAIYTESEDVAKELGSTEKFNKKKPRTGSTGDVLGVKDGYVLVDFGDFESLIDIEAIEAIPRPTDIKYIVRYIRPNISEEFVSEDDIQKRLQKLIAEGHIKIEDEMKVYEISKAKVLKIKLDIFLE